MTGDDYDDTGKKTAENRRDDFAESLEKLLSDHTEMRMIIGPLLRHIQERDLINRNQHRKGDDSEKRTKFNQDLNERARAFFIGTEHPMRKIQIKDLEKAHLEEQEIDVWIRKGQKYKIELEKLPNSKQGEIWQETNRILAIMLKDKATIFDFELRKL